MSLRAIAKQSRTIWIPFLTSIWIATFVSLTRDDKLSLARYDSSPDRGRCPKDRGGWVWSHESYYCGRAQLIRAKSQLSRYENLHINVKSKIFLDFSEQIMIVKQEKKIWFQPFIYYYNKPWTKLILWKKQSNFL